MWVILKDGRIKLEKNLKKLEKKFPSGAGIETEFHGWQDSRKES